MVKRLGRPILSRIFALKGNFAPGLDPTFGHFSEIEITPFLGGARASATISADFEIAWAFRGRSREERTRKAVTCRRNVPSLIRMLEKVEIPITWATVGHLFLDRCERGVSGHAHPEMPRPPKNLRWEGDWYRHDPCTDLKTDPHWYAPDLIDLIRSSKVKHEIGSHSFSHIDFSTETSTRELVRCELEACKSVMQARGIRLRSLVYPFNNMGHHYHDLMAKIGLTAVRHRDPKVRLSYPERNSSGIYKLCESMNLRRAKHYDYIEKADIFLNEAMRRQASYHIWFHPSDPTEIFEHEFCGILDRMAKLRRCGDLWIATMEQLAAYCEARRSVQLKTNRLPASVRIELKWAYDQQRYGYIDLTLRIPVPRAPVNAMIRLEGRDSEVSVKMEPGGRQPACLVDVPNKTELLVLNL